MATQKAGPFGVITTKGDILSSTDGENVERVGVGPNNTIPIADSSKAAGWSWATLAGLGVGEGSTFPYGGDIKSPLNYYHAHGDFASGQGSSLNNETVIVMPFSGLFINISWFNDSADATTTLNVIKNGVSVDTVMLTGLSGTVALGAVAFVGGDEIAIQYDSGTKPGKGTLTFAVQKV
jgi:hypothetical protein